MKLYGVWIGAWVQGIGGDFAASRESAEKVAHATGPYAFALPYNRGHFPLKGRCTLCGSGNLEMWCPHSNSRSHRVAELARKLWETDDRLAPHVMQMGEGRDIGEEGLDRLWAKDVGGLRGECVARAELIVGEWPRMPPGALSQ